MRVICRKQKSRGKRDKKRMVFFAYAEKKIFLPNDPIVLGATPLRIIIET